ncbi:MAG: hypothetical protein AAGF04_00830 [Chlamydiota bacterium]
MNLNVFISCHSLAYVQDTNFTSCFHLGGLQSSKATVLTGLPFEISEIPGTFYKQSLTPEKRKLFQETAKAHVTGFLVHRSLLKALDDTQAFFDKEARELGIKTGVVLMVSVFVLSLLFHVMPHVPLSIFFFSIIGFGFYWMKFASSLDLSEHIAKRVVAIKNSIKQMEDVLDNSFVIAQYMTHDPLKTTNIKLNPVSSFTLFFTSNTQVISPFKINSEPHLDKQFLDRFWKVAEFKPTPNLSQKQAVSLSPILRTN